MRDPAAALASESYVRMMRPAIAVLTAVLFALLASGGASRPVHAQATPDTMAFTIEEAIVHALDVSPEVGVERAGQDFAEARRRLALSSRFLTDFTATSAHAVAPGLDIPADNAFPDKALYLNPDVRNDWDDLRPFNRIEVEFTQPLYTWGQLGGSIRAARFGVDVERADVSSTRLDVALRTGQLFYGLLLAEALLRLAEETGAVVDRARDEISRLIDEGAEDVDYADLYQLQITEQEYNRRVVEVTRRRMTARMALARQLFLPEGVVATTANQMLEPIAYELDSLDHYQNLALENRPELAKAAAGLAARSALVEVARSDYFPKLFLAGSARISAAAGRIRQPNPYISDPFIGRSVRAGLGLRQTLNFAQTRARVDQAEAERNEVAYQQTAARQLVLFEVEEAYNNVIIARSALDSQSESLRLSKEWLQTESINFDLDLGDTENLVDAVRTNLELEASYFDAVNRYNVSILRLLASAGVLDDVVISGTLVE